MGSQKGLEVPLVTFLSLLRALLALVLCAMFAFALKGCTGAPALQSLAAQPACLAFCVLRTTAAETAGDYSETSSLTTKGQ